MERRRRKKRCLCRHSANKQKVNTERDTRCCLSSSTCPLRFHTRPFLPAVGQKARKSQHLAAPGALGHNRGEKKPHNTFVCRDSNMLRSRQPPSHLPSQEETLAGPRRRCHRLWLQNTGPILAGFPLAWMSAWAGSAAESALVRRSRLLLTERSRLSAPAL